MAPYKVVEKSPYEIWVGKVPKLSFLKIRRCETYIKWLTSDMLALKSDRCLFVGYLKEINEYYFYNHSENNLLVEKVSFRKNIFSKRKVWVSLPWRHSRWATNRNEDSYLEQTEMKTPFSTSLETPFSYEVVQENPKSVLETTADVAQPVKSQRHRIQLERY